MGIVKGVVKMAVLPVVKYPDPLLHEKSKNIEDINDEIKELVSDMAETMYAVEGVGLAAVQIGKLLNLFVIDPVYAGGTEKDPVLVFINPKIIKKEGFIKEEEGCLSLPGVFISLKRSVRTVVRALDLEGNEFEMEGKGLLSKAFQHEFDHLHGTLIIDKVGKLKRKIAMRKLETD
jgi:peptide deformylase